MGALLDSRSWKKMGDAPYSKVGEDVWLLKGTGGGRTGAVRIMKPKPEFVAAWLVELESCNSCAEGTPVKHGTTSIWPDGSIYTYQCRSFSRSLNPITGEIDGNPHCTCDGCW